MSSHYSHTFLEPPLGVLFDMDGVLFDTMPVHADSWYETAQHFRIPASRDEFYLYEGQKGYDTICHIYERAFGEKPSEETIADIYQYKTKLFTESIRVRLIPDVDKLIHYLYGRGLRIGVVTGSAQKDSIQRITEYFGQYIRPQRIVTADSVQRGKPHPDPFLKGLEMIDTGANSTVVIENAPYGVEAAARAGCFVIAVATGPIPHEVLYEKGANIVLKDMRTVLEWWKDTFAI